MRQSSSLILPQAQTVYVERGVCCSGRARLLPARTVRISCNFLSFDGVVQIARCKQIRNTSLLWLHWYAVVCKILHNDVLLKPISLSDAEGVCYSDEGG